MIHCSRISKSYAHLHVLKDVSLDIQKGEVVCIVGPSGAGKSTLLHILGTLDAPDSGTVLLDNTDITRLNDKDLAAFRNQNLGFVFQFHHLLPEFTALENVCIPGFIANKNEKEVMAKAAVLLTELGLGERLQHRPSELSGGEQQRVSVARALINDPKVIFADEPTGNLDSQRSGELHRLFFDLRDKRGQTFVIVTHNEELAAQADRVLTMRDGRLEQA